MQDGTQSLAFGLVCDAALRLDNSYGGQVIALDCELNSTVSQLRSAKMTKFYKEGATRSLHQAAPQRALNMARREAKKNKNA